MPRTVPVMASESPGNYNTAALWNASTKALGDFLAGTSSATGVPRFRGRQTSAQSIVTSTFTSITLDTEDFDSDGGHSTVTNTSRYTVQVAGTYLIIGEACFPSNATGNRGSRITVNGSNIPGGASMIPAPSGNAAGAPAAALVALAVGDYVEIQGWQSSGGNLSTAVVTDFASSLNVVWMSS